MKVIKNIDIIDEYLSAKGFIRKSKYSINSFHGTGEKFFFYKNMELSNGDPIIVKLEVGHLDDAPHSWWFSLYINDELKSEWGHIENDGDSYIDEIECVEDEIKRFLY